MYETAAENKDHDKKQKEKGGRGVHFEGGVLEVGGKFVGGGVGSVEGASIGGAAARENSVDGSSDGL